MKSPRIIPLILLILILSGLLILTSCVQVQSPAGQSGSQAIVITSLVPSQIQTFQGGTVYIQSSVKGPQGESLLYKWSCSGGHFVDSGANNTWVAPSQYGNYDITLLVEDSKGNKAQSTVTVFVAANKPPVISSLNTDQADLLYGGMTTITCIANDPDGDALRYSWTASEGTVSGIGNKVTWVAPHKGGNFSITVIVSDGKAETRQNVMVRVMTATNTTTISLIRQESGTVSSTGDKDTTRFRAGDDGKNEGYRCFFSFNIFSLNGTRVNAARLKFGPVRISGDPFAPVTGLGGLRFWKVKYGEGLPDFNVLGEVLDRAGALFPSTPGEIDVTPELVNLVAGAADRFQVETLFQNTYKKDNIAKFIEFSDAVLEVTFAPK